MASSPDFQLMTTALVKAFGTKNRQVQARVLLDTCATANFITTKLVQILNLPKIRCCMSIGAVNNLSTTINSMTNVTFQSLHSEYKRTLCFLIVPSISDLVPCQAIPRERLKLPRNIRLADPDFHKPAPVDMLIGSGPTLSLFSIGNIDLSQNGNDLILQKTQLGWILGGGLNLPKATKHDNTISCMLSDLKETIEKFWVVEELPGNSRFTQEELECEAHFKQHVTRDKDGRYIVALPFKQSPHLLGESKTMALKRMKQLMNKFAKDANFKKEYTDAINKLLDAKHMSRSKSNDNSGFYLPHHAVIKTSSSTTKLRVVFDGSAKTTQSSSLNDILMLGPTIQDSLFSLVIRSRTYKYILMADIEKMFLQFLVREEDRKYLKLLWLVDNEIDDHTLNTVTFGLKTAPFLAIRCLHQLAEDEGADFPLAAKILKNDMYVDNLITGTNSRTEAREIYEQMTELLSRAQLNMRQWVSNDKTILAGVDERSLETSILIDKDSDLKALGMYWKVAQDCYICKIIPISLPRRVTKRMVLSEIAKLFDPLGLLGPVILYAKRIMQNVWQARVTWDESVPSSIHYDWQTFCEQLVELNNISFPRLVLIDGAIRVELHGFSDASEKGYGACIYLVSWNAAGECLCVLLCAKSRVAPLKKHTIPRLELMGALLLAELFELVMQSIKIVIHLIVYWVDSEIVLHWLHTPSSALKTFVGNRVSQIQDKTEIKNWRHVRTFDNPADALSRGQLPIDFVKNNMWIEGPKWLKLGEKHWPISNFKPKDSVLPETKKVTCLKLVVNFDPLKRFSSFRKLRRAVAMWFRLVIAFRYFKTDKFNIDEVIKICKKLTLKELKRAETTIIKIIQRDSYHHEIECLKKDKELDKPNRILNLDPFIDEVGLLRVGGRLSNSTLSYNRKHPIILPKAHCVTDLIINHYHLIHYHTGVQTTLHTLRQRYWLVDGRKDIRRVIRQCVRCFRASPKLAEHKMGNLPEVRTQLTRAFIDVGVDYCGPFYIKERRRKGRVDKKMKMYIAVFVCMASKAVHIEVVADLTTEAFIGALRCFCATRGRPRTIYADNATNFRGAKNELRELHDMVNSQYSQSEVFNFANEKGIEFHFIPPSSPHFGGLWEAGVKSYKHHFKRVASNHVLTHMEFYTLSKEIEAILNSRPLTPIPNDANDLSALTPGHQLIGDSLIALPEPDLLRLPSNRLSAWQLVTKMRQDFWKRWHTEYLNELNVRQKWNVKTENPKEGMVVVLKEDNTPTMQWPLARITQLHKGKDGIVRTVTLKTANGELKRPVRKIAILPIE